MSEVLEGNGNVLPAEFDGVFKFTNATDEDFSSKWNSVEYTFLAGTTSPMIIPGETPEGVQNIRKKFARELAEREFWKTPKFAHMNGPEQGSRPALYTEADLEPFIKECLVPLAPGRVTAKATADPVAKEKVFHRDESGTPRTKVLRSKASGDATDDSLLGEGTTVA